jgi:predicted DNA binding CopG/RHH family protein
VPDIGEKGKNCMKKDTRYSKAPEGVDDALISAQIIEDFLPPPEKLIPKEATRKITITLSRKSVEFFKEKSKESQVPYQQMIRKVLDNYTEVYSHRNNG